ncbi:MAG TPA: hypothetical protein VGE43_01905 [Acidimicrobiales bacterium]
MTDDVPAARFRDGRGRLLSDPSELGDVELRYVLCDLIAGAAGATCTVGELVDTIERCGFRLAGRPSKVISDALRTEVARGRVVRVGRGRYRVGSIPGSTRRRIRKVTRHRIALAGSWPPERVAGSLDP